VKCINCGMPVVPINLGGTRYTHTPEGWFVHCDDPHPTRKTMTPEEMQAGDILPQIGETIAHVGKQYECTEVVWERDEDEIVVTYRRRFADAEGNPLPDPFKRGWMGTRVAATWIDETHLLPDAAIFEFSKQQNPPEWGNRDGG
jgi:hypothetical protein